MKNGITITWAAIVLLFGCIALGWWGYSNYKKLQLTQSEMAKKERQWEEEFASLQEAYIIKSFTADSLKHKIEQLRTEILVLESPMTMDIIEAIEYVNDTACIPIGDIQLIKMEMIDMTVIINKQEEIITEQDRLIRVQEEMIGVLTKERDGYIELYEDARDALDKDVKRERRMKRIFAGSVPIAFVVGLILI